MIPLAALLGVLIKVVIGGLVFWLFWWFIDFMETPQPFNKVLKVIIGLCALIFLVNILLGLSGTSLFR